MVRAGFGLGGRVEREKSRFPSGMTTRRARARATADSFAALRNDKKRGWRQDLILAWGNWDIWRRGGFRRGLQWTIVCFSSLVDVISVIKTRRWVHGLAVGWMLVGGVWSARAGQAPAVATAAAGSAGGWTPVPMPAAAPTVTKFFPLSEVKRGMKGVAYTVFEGVNPEPMQVEILGLLKDALGPGQDMILARLHGEKPEYTGVVAGMSGSPVYIDGRLVGALSYRIGQFSREPIAGITPIQQMLEVRDGQRGPAVQFADDGTADSSASLRNDNELGGLTGAMAHKAVSGGGEVQPIDTALVFGAFSQDAIALFGDKFRAMGMKPVAGLGGAAEPGKKQPEPIVPGSAVSAVLVRGDLSISGTCTVTYVDPHQLLACGHPITQFGPVSMPMTKAEVVTTLASPLDSFKIINKTETVGSLDRQSTR